MIPNVSKWRRLMRPKLWIPVVVAGAAGGVWMIRSGSSDAAVKSSDAYFTAESGPFTVALPTGGSLEAVDEVKVRNRVPGNTQILSLVKEGTVVEKGELLIELDSSDIENRLSQAEIAYQQSLSAVAEQEERYENLKSENIIKLRDTELAVEFAKTDLRKYEEGQFPQLKKKADSAIGLASEELRRAEDRLNGTRRLEEKGYATPSERVADELAVKRREVELQSAEEELRLLIEFDAPRQRRQLETNVENTKVVLDRTRRQADTQLEKAEMQLTSSKETLALRKQSLDELHEAREHTQIFAPQGGLVVYEKPRGWGSEPIEEGSTVRERQELISLPDVSRMKVRVNIYENQISLVKPGMHARITLDALPDRTFTGEVSKIASMPEPARDNNPNYRVYKAEVLVTDELPEVKPGVTAKVDILIAELADVVKVPLQAVIGADDRNFCFVQHGKAMEPVEVKVGLFDSDFVEIRQGLTVGDLVSLTPPKGLDGLPEAEPNAPPEDDELLSSTQ
ncbi:HlyD family secretion protein [Haloferula luteola]|uniref:HlyD family secretion protein n=1 Tax=Haloferula luteola TaxID=595692 RepID=A0A840UZ33_9BACT|nr:efflux RND transporter periplasmic adaptor subunit [Haloferula luteola]MBB5350263.1 HlyD family secretion protein [Haloferula luteola]